MARRIREKLAALDIEVNGKFIKATLSIGLAGNEDEESIFYDSLLKRTESALNRVLSRGGDGLEIFEAEE